MDFITFFETVEKSDFEDGDIMWTRAYNFDPPNAHGVQGVVKFENDTWKINSVLTSNLSQKHLVWPAQLRWKLSVVKNNNIKAVDGRDRVTWNKDDVGKCDWTDCIKISHGDLQRDELVDTDGFVTFMWFVELAVAFSLSATGETREAINEYSLEETVDTADAEWESKEEMSQDARTSQVESSTQGGEDKTSIPLAKAKRTAKGDGKEDKTQSSKNNRGMSRHEQDINLKDNIIITKKVRRGKLKEADYTKIWMNFNWLLDELDAHFLVNELFSKGVLDIDDKQEIDGERTRRKRTDTLLQRILHSGPGDSFEIFVEILKINYPDVAEKLTKQDRPELDYSTSVPAADETKADSGLPSSGTSSRSDVSDVSSSLILKCKTNCPKKPTHEHFIPFPAFKECRPDDIPPEIYKYLVNLGKQTVRVLTKYISPDRPDGYPLYERKGSNGKATGSGRIYRVLRKFSEKDDKTCPCQDCLRSSRPKKQWGEFMVITTKKVVYNDEECAQSYCLFGYDSPDMRGTCPELRGVRVITEDISTDVCEIVSITHNSEVSLGIEEICRKNSELSSKISDKCYSKPDEPAPNLAVVISHPHGLSKHVTIGYCVEHEPTEVGQTPSVTYTADACSGSHGGPVFLLNSRMACCTSHRETTQIGSNFGSGVLWSL